MSLEGKKILIVDDEPSIRKMLRVEFEMEGSTNVSEAGNGSEALAVLSQSHFDVVVSDVKMPVMDGVELLEAILKKNSDLPKVVLLMTGFSDYSKDDLLKRGAMEVFAKPIDIPGMVKAIEARLNN